MARATKEEALETRNRIIDAAEEVFYARGLAQTSLADVAVAADVTRGAIYWHFKNKADLFEAMADRVCLPMESLMNTPLEQYANDPLGHLRSTWIHLLHDAAQNERTRRVLDILFLKCELVDRNDPIWIRQQACYLSGLDNMERILKDAIVLKQLPADLNTRLAVLTLHGQVIGLLMNWLFCPDAFDLAEVAEQVIDTCIDSLRYAPSQRLKQA
ncbi:TetR family transcriptional regulator [Oxalicibacterium flavum]|uniref:TetR family transcriptional regulator n=1 Tax=Oxalicibacterium flavum TaxID=179467 RepID=A0A8J2UQC1_9BURK|nr:TetR family transcriptional regulator [Oxalicibacterium flavum]GGC08537.1 TetR family transcriptional regulator [Oxalicibacterium flavum]